MFSVILTGCNYVELTLSVFVELHFQPYAFLPGARATNFWPHPWWPKTWITYLVIVWSVLLLVISEPPLRVQKQWQWVTSCNVKYQPSYSDTLPKTKIALEKMASQEESSLPTTTLQVLCFRESSLFHFLFPILSYNSWILYSGSWESADQESLVQISCLKPASGSPCLFFPPKLLPAWWGAVDRVKYSLPFHRFGLEFLPSEPTNLPDGPMASGEEFHWTRLWLRQRSVQLSRCSLSVANAARICDLRILCVCVILQVQIPSEIFFLHCFWVGYLKGSEWRHQHVDTFPLHRSIQASCGCPVYVGFHFYAYDCMPEASEGGVNQIFQRKSEKTSFICIAERCNHLSLDVSGAW